MNSILKNIVWLKIPLYKVKPNGLNVRNITRNFGNESKKIHVDLLRTHAGQNQGKLSLRISHKFRREYSKKIGKTTSDQMKVIDARKKKQHSDDCMVIKDGRVTKRKHHNQNDKLLENEDYDPTFFIYETDPIPEIKEVLEINNKIRQEKKERTRLDRHFINKIFHPISKREKKLKSSKNCEGKLPSFKPLKKYFSTAKRGISKYENKKRPFQKHSYKDVVVPEEHRNMYPYFVQKLNEADASKNKNDRQRFPLLKTKKKESLPLYMIVKEMSEKSKVGNKNLVYKVCNNMATYNDKKTIFYDPNLRTEQEKKLQKSPSKELPKSIVGNPENFFFATEKCKGKITNFYSLNSRNLTVDEDYKEKLTRTIRYLLQPVIEQEYMKYNELRSTLERMEKNMDTFFKQTKYVNDQEPWAKSLEVQSVIPNDLVNIFDKGRSKIRDPSLKQEIKDPMELKNEHKDPAKKSVVTVPCYRKDKIQDPRGFEVMIAKDDSKKGKKPCPKLENPCQKKPVQKEKEEPCEEVEYTCKEEDSSQDPFKKAKSKADGFLSSESCDQEQKSAEPVDPFKKSRSKATSFMPAGTQATECFFAKEEKAEPVYPFKKSKSKVGSFYPPGGVEGKIHCDQGVKDQKNVPFKTVKQKKEAFVSENETEPCVDPCKRQVPCKPQRLDEACPSVPDFGKSKQTGKSACCDRESCTSISHDKVEIPAFCAPKVESKKMQLPCATDHPKPMEKLEVPPPPLEPPKKKCPIHETGEMRYCKKPQKKYEPPKVEPAPKGYMQACRVPPRPVEPPHKTPRFSEPRQYPKKTWIPVKLKGRKSKMRKSRSEPTLHRQASASQADGAKKGFLEGCKGLFAAMCKMFCPGKSTAGKKGAAIGAAASQSMPELRNYSKYNTSDQRDGSDGKNSKKKKAFKEKYPWKKGKNSPRLAKEKFFNSKAKEKFYVLKKRQQYKKKILASYDQKKNEERPKEGLQIPPHPSTYEEIMETSTKNEENPPKKKQSPHKLRPKISAFGEVTKRSKCFKAGQNHHQMIVLKKIRPRFKMDRKQYSSQSKSGRSSKIRKKYPWTNKMERGHLEDCTKECLITQLALKKQKERDLEEKALEKYLNTSKIEEADVKMDREKEEDLKIVHIIKMEQKDSKEECTEDKIEEKHPKEDCMEDKVEEKQHPKEECMEDKVEEKHPKEDYIEDKVAEKQQPKEDCKEDRNETKIEEQPEDLEIKRAELCQSENLQKKEKGKYQLAPASTQEKPKVKHENCLENKPKCEEDSKMKKEDEKCVEKSDQSLQKQCTDLCVTPKPVKKMPYKEEKEEKCYDPQFLICEVKKLGNCEQLICKPMKKPQPLCGAKKSEEKEEKKQGKVLKCKVVHDDCNRQCLICKEIKPSGENTEENSKQKKKDKILTISNKLVCKEETIPVKETKEISCKPMEVREIKGEKEDEEKQKKFAKVGKKPSPFTYQDLLKKGEEVRREAEQKLKKKKKEEKKPSC